MFRIGPAFDADPAKREVFPGSQFDPASFDALSKEIVPRFPGQDAVELEAYEQLVMQACPCIIVAHSSGGYFATILAAQHPDLVRAIVAAEMTAAPDPVKLDIGTLARVPELLVWGDNQAAFPAWRTIRAAVDGFAAQARERGAAIETLDLPRQGISGNTHVPMMDRNQQAIAKLVSDWLDARKLQ